MDLQRGPDGAQVSGSALVEMITVLAKRGASPEDIGRAVAAFTGVPSAAAPALPPPSKTLRELWTLYSQVRGPELSSWADMQHRGEVVLAAEIEVDGQRMIVGDIPASHLSVHHLDAYRAKRRLENTVRYGRPTTPALRNREVSVLCSICSWAVKHKHLQFSPIRGAPMETEDNVREVVVTDEQAFDFASKCARAGDRTTAALTLLLHGSGLRLAEGQQLQLTDIDEERLLAEVRRSTAKGKKARLAPMSAVALAAIKAMPTWPGKRWVFENQVTGKPVSKRALTKRFDRMRERFNFAGANGEMVWRHDLRRTHITLHVRSGADRDTVKKGSGHATDAAFKRYNVTSVDDLMAARRVRDEELLSKLKEMTRKDAHRSESSFLHVLLSAAQAHSTEGK